MKKLYIAIVTVVLSLVGNSVWASNSVEGNNNASASSATYYINAPRFVRPLIEKWISEYKKVAPQANFAIAKTAESKSKSKLNILLEEKDNDNKLVEKNVYFAQYAILPVAGKNSDAAKELGKQELNVKNVKALYFEKDDFEELNKNEKKAAAYVVYSGSGNQSVSAEFASHYGKDASTFRGKRIVGDDQFLNSAILKDPKGITFNAIPNLYDLSTRQLKADLALLPLDVDKNQRAAFEEGATLDDVLQVLENTKNSNIPVERVGFTFQGDDEAISQFISWVLSEGESYNHEYGLLRLDATLVAQQVKELSTRLTAQK